MQFLGQVFAIPLLRKKLPDSARPYKMWLYPLAAVIAFFGWTFAFVTSGRSYITAGLLTLVVGIVFHTVRACDAHLAVRNCATR